MNEGKDNNLGRNMRTRETPKKIGNQIRSMHKAHEHEQSLFGKTPATERNHLTKFHDDQGTKYMTLDFKQEHVNIWRKVASQPASIRNTTADQKCHDRRSEIAWKNRNIMKEQK